MTGSAADAPGLSKSDEDNLDLLGILYWLYGGMIAVGGAMFALFANARGDPPDRRMVKQHRLHGRLCQIHQRVVALDMGKLVRQYSFQLKRRQAR